MNTIKLVQITKGVVSTRYSALFLCLTVFANKKFGNRHLFFAAEQLGNLPVRRQL